MEFRKRPEVDLLVNVQAFFDAYIFADHEMIAPGIT